MLIVVALLVVLEATARLVYTVHLNVAKPADWFAYVPDLGWDRRPGFKGRDDCNTDRAFDAQGLVASEAARLQQKPAGQFRAVFLGDSNTYGTCAPTEETFVGVANRLVPQAAAINLGVNGYTSYQGYKALLKYGERIRPDLIFVSFNFNDRRLVLRPEEADSEAAFRHLYRSNLIRHFTEVSYLFGAARLVSNWLSPPKDLAATARLGDGYSAEARLDKVRPRVDARAYRENLKSIVQWAKQNGSAVAFIVLGDNPKMTEALKDGVKYFAEKNYDMAIDYLMDSKDDSY
ncbi:MAG: SGNH/GDSL hydrolase family protein, partial [bacterium]